MECRQLCSPSLLGFMVVTAPERRGSWEARRRAYSYHNNTDDWSMALQTVQDGSMLFSMSAKLVCSAAWSMYQQRPRGWSRQDLLCVRESSLGSKAGKGVFSKVAIEKDVILGAYPGRVRNDVEMTAKCLVAPMAQYYCFSKKPGVILDPSDESGFPSPRPSPGCWWPWEIDCTLSYVNEPSLGMSVNVRVEDDEQDLSTGLVFVADRDIIPGEELFIDYGKDYDRTGY